jgi:UrcA family protein
MLKLARHVSCSLFGVVCAVSAASGVPAFGQGSNEFTVLGHNTNPYYDSPSAAISYRDLNLANSNDRAVLRQRVWRTAEKLCARIGEGHIGSATQVLSCEDQVVLSAAQQEHDAIARAMTAPANKSVASGGPAGGGSILTVSVAASR